MGLARQSLHQRTLRTRTRTTAPPRTSRFGFSPASSRHSSRPGRGRQWQRGDHRLGVSSVGLFSFETWAPVHYWVPVPPLMPLRLSAGLQVVLVGTTGLEMQSSLNRGGFYYIFFWGGASYSSPYE